MKIFISWSGNRSHEVAKLLNEWIQCVLQAVDPWLSSKDIDRGSLWFSSITNELSTTQNGIICLTKSNLERPWILFEAGALAKGLSTNRIYTFLIDLKPRDIKDPLAQFNHSEPTKDGMYQLIRSINNGIEENNLKEDILKNVFETYWPQFQSRFKEILKNTPDENIEKARPKDDLLNEILYSVRGIDKRLRTVENEPVKFERYSGPVISESALRRRRDLKRKIYELKILGNSSKEISEKLGISYSTIKRYLPEILKEIKDQEKEE